MVLADVETETGGGSAPPTPHIALAAEGVRLRNAWSEDPPLPGAIGTANGVRADVEPGHPTAIRDAAGYELVSDQHDCSDAALDDLVADPMELVPLSPESIPGPALEADDALSADLAAMALD